jgi:hypothetical protein
MVFPGEKRAIEYLQSREPEIYTAMAQFYATSDLEEQIEIQRALSQQILAPIGGPWRGDELLAFGDEDVSDLQERGRRVFHSLFGHG